MSKYYISILLTLIVIGTIFDYQITNSLFGNLYFPSKIIEIITDIPYIFGLVFSFIILANCYQNKYKKLFFLLLSFISSVVLICRVIQYLEVDLYVYLILFIIALVTCFILNYVVKKYELYKYKKSAIYAILFIIITFTFTTLIKHAWGRPRYLTINGNLELFARWYEINGWATSNSFMSFISGHANAAFSLVWVLFYLNKSYIKYLIILWGILVSISRLLLGKHFLTDVCFAALISYSIYYVFDYLYKNN